MNQETAQVMLKSLENSRRDQGWELDDGAKSSAGETLEKTSTAELLKAHRDLTARLERKPDNRGLQVHYQAIDGELQRRGVSQEPELVQKSVDVSAIDELGEYLAKGGPYIGPKGGKWADAKHTIPWEEGAGEKAKTATEASMKPSDIERPPPIGSYKKWTEQQHRDEAKRLATPGGPHAKHYSASHMVRMHEQLAEHKRDIAGGAKGETQMKAARKHHKEAVAAHEEQYGDKYQPGRTPKEDVQSGLKKDEADLAKYKEHLKTLESGGKVGHLSIENAKKAIIGLTAAIANKKKLLNKSMDAIDDLSAHLSKSEKIPGGLASGKKSSDFDAKALAAGTKVEMEHTKDKKVAQEIAQDHLTEDPKYYEKLARMEKSMDKTAKAIKEFLAKNPKPEDEAIHALAKKLGMEPDDLEEKIYAMLGKKLKKGLPSEEADITPEKARKILHDGEVHGHPLTEQQRKFFGAIASKAKKTEKSMTAIDELEAYIEEPMSKSLYGMDWVNRFVGTPFEVEALQCVKELSAFDGERAEIRKKYPYGMDEEDRVKRAKLSQKRDDAYQKINAKEDTVQKRQSDIEKKYLDWRIEQAKEAKKSEGDDGLEAIEKALPPGDHKTPPKEYREGGATKKKDYADPKGFKYPIDTEEHVRAAISYFSKPKNAGVYSAAEQKTIWGRIKSAAKKFKIEVSEKSGPPSVEKSVDAIDALGEHLQKSDIPTGQRTGLPTGETGNPEDGGPLAGLGKPSGSPGKTEPRSDEGAPSPQEKDWAEEEEALRVLGGHKLTGTTSLAKGQAIVDRAIKRGAGEITVHPYRTSQMHADTNERVEALHKGATNERDPRNAVISREALCKSCSGRYPAMFTACPHCGDGAVGQTVLSKGGQAYSLDEHPGNPMFRPSNPQRDILIKR